MPIFTTTVEVPADLAEVFAFFSQPKNLLALALPEIQLTLVQGPEQLEPGTVLIWKARRWGLAQQMTVRVREVISEKIIVVEQEKGPLKKWRHEQLFEGKPGATILCDKVEYEPPGGILGLTVTARWIEEDLERSFAFRDRQLKELFPGPSS